MSTEQIDATALLKIAGQIPAGLQLEDYNPMEAIPTIAVGAEFAQGTTVAGFYEETQVVASPKFVHSKTRNEKGVPTQLLHVLRIGSPAGERLGIWTTGELKAAFDRLPAGAFVAITYKGKGVNAKGQQQHFFEFKRALPASN
ncbi:MAG: hypothetical protein HC883_00265 [Bdellovibrionaceae bacterium]|nr:hypothetical protein [Pseudobdellovibrionaceae bacterium]